MAAHEAQGYKGLTPAQKAIAHTYTGLWMGGLDLFTEEEEPEMGKAANNIISSMERWAKAAAIPTAVEIRGSRLVFNTKEDRKRHIDYIESLKKAFIDCL